MAKPKADERVRLMRDVPELGLRRGDTGVVCSTWFDPSTAYEVEFQRDGRGCPVRAMLMPDQIQRDAKMCTN